MCIRDSPTGAGDTFLGALAGYLSTLPPGLPPFEEVKKGIVYGTVAASFTLSLIHI